MSIRVTLFEDNNYVRESLSVLIKGTEGLELAGAFPHCLDLLQDIETSRPDIVLMDIEMPGISGVEAVKKIRETHPDLTVIMLTVFEQENLIFEALCNGASGYLLKGTPPAELLTHIFEASKGGAPMSPSVAKKVIRLFQSIPLPKQTPDYGITAREKEILTWLSKGHSYKMIAAECNISFDTVRSHIRNIYEKLHVASMTEAVSKALKEGLV